MVEVAFKLHLEELVGFEKEGRGNESNTSTVMSLWWCEVCAGEGWGAVQGSGRLTLSLMARALPTSSYDLLRQVETMKHMSFAMTLFLGMAFHLNQQLLLSTGTGPLGGYSPSFDGYF